MNIDINIEYFEYMNLPITTSDTVRILESLKSFYRFENTMLPPEISLQDIISTSRFLSPQIVLIHGSYVTKVRYSPCGDRDYDMIIVSTKIPFWSKESLYTEIQDRFRQLSKSINFDISLATLHGLLAHIHGKTSLGQSILQGFSIILYVGDTNGY